MVNGSSSTELQGFGDGHKSSLSAVTCCKSPHGPCPLFLQTGKPLFHEPDKYFSGICMVKAMQPFSAALGIRLGDALGLLKVFDQSHLKKKKDLLLEQLTAVTGIRQICRLFWREVRA